MIRKFTFVCVALAIFSLMGLSGCNTIKGMGKDIEKAGEAIQGAMD